MPFFQRGVRLTPEERAKVSAGLRLWHVTHRSKYQIELDEFVARVHRMREKLDKEIKDANSTAKNAKVAGQKPGMDE